MTIGNQNVIGWRQAGITATAFLAFTVLSFPQNSSSPSALNREPDRVRRLVLVSVADRRLAVLEDGEVLAYFRIAVGAPASPSPTGEFEIVNRVANPAYYHDGMVMSARENSPVGTRWIGLNLKGYGIHGTNAPKSIGQAASHGCIRLNNRDVERLYSMLHIGDAVKIREERDDETERVFGGAVDVAAAEMAQASGQ